MPVYEYHCTECEHEFDEFLTSMNAHEPQVCPNCGANAVVRKLSVFAARQGTARSAQTTSADGCGRCGDPNGPCMM